MYEGLHPLFQPERDCQPRLANLVKLREPLREEYPVPVHNV